MTASWRAVARKDFEDAVRSRMLWSLTGVFVAFLVLSLLSASELFPETVTVDAAKALSGVAMLAQLFVPGIALVAGYLSVTGERTAGSIRVLLSYPFSRTDVVVGKLVGRSLVTGVPLLVGLAVASALVVVRFGAPAGDTLAGFLGATVLLALTFTGIAVGGSAAAAERGRAMGLTIGSFVGMVFFWKPVAVGAYWVLEGSLPGLRVEAWYLLLKRLNPLGAYRALAGAALDERVSAVPEFPLEAIPPGTPTSALTVGNRVTGAVPFYLQDWFAVVVLLAWGVLPLAWGHRRFVRSDLG